MADGTEYVIGIKADGSQAATAAVSLDSLAASLDRTNAASSAASAALAAGQAAYAAAEATANKAALAVERIGVAGTAAQGKLAAALEAGDAAGIERATAKLDQLRQRNEEAQAASTAAQAALEGQAASLDNLAASAEQAAADGKQVVEASKAMASASGGGEIKLGEMAESLGKVGGPAGVVGQKLAGLGNAFKKLAAMGPAGVFIAVAVAAVAVVASVVMAGIALLKFGLASADAARTQSLLAAGIAGSVAGGVALEASIDSLASRVPIAADELQNMAASLAKTGLKGEALTSALEDAAVKAAKLKFGPEFERAMLGADFQSQKLKRDLAKMFGGLNIEGLLAGLKSLGDLFDGNSASAKAIKVVFESMFQPLVDGATGMIPAIVAGFLQFEIWALKGLISIQKYQPIFSVIGAYGSYVFGQIGDAVSVAVAIVEGSVAGFMMMLDAGMAAFDGISGAADRALEILMGLDMGAVGTALMKGLTVGITGGGSLVVEAITNVAGNAIAAAKKKLGIASPSRVFASLGSYTSEGFAQGVDAGAGDAQASMTAMVAPPAGAGAAAPAATATASSGGNTFVINITAAGGDDIAAKVKAAILDLLEGDARQIGAMA